MRTDVLLVLTGRAPDRLSAEATWSGRSFRECRFSPLRRSRSPRLDPVPFRRTPRRATVTLAMEWVTVEVFDRDAAAWTWRDQYADVLVIAAITAGAVCWEWHAHGCGVVLEVCLPGDAAVEVFRALPAVGAALEAAPDPVNGVLVYRGRGGSAGTGVPRRPWPHLGAGAVALPEPDDIPPPPGRAPALLTLVAS